MQIRKWLDWIGEKVAENAVSGVVTAAATVLAAWGATHHVPWTTAVIYGALSFGGMAMGINQLAQIRDRRRVKRLANAAPSVVEARLRVWLHRPGWSVGPDPHDDLDFRLKVQARDIAVTVFQKRGEPWVTIGSILAFERKEREFLRVAAPLLFKDMGIALALLGVSAEEQELDSGAMNILVTYQVLPEELNGPLALLRAIGVVRRAISVGANMGQRAAMAAALKSLPRQQ